MSVLGQEQFSAAIPQRAPVRWKHHQQVLFIKYLVTRKKIYVYTSSIFKMIYLILDKLWN